MQLRQILYKNMKVNFIIKFLLKDVRPVTTGTNLDKFSQVLFILHRGELF